MVPAWSPLVPLVMPLLLLSVSPIEVVPAAHRPCRTHRGRAAVRECCPPRSCSSASPCCRSVDAAAEGRAVAGEGAVRHASACRLLKMPPPPPLLAELLLRVLFVSVSRAAIVDDAAAVSCDGGVAGDAYCSSPSPCRRCGSPPPPAMPPIEPCWIVRLFSVAVTPLFTMKTCTPPLMQKPLPSTVQPPSTITPVPLVGPVIVTFPATVNVCGARQPDLPLPRAVERDRLRVRRTRRSASASRNRQVVFVALWQAARVPALPPSLRLPTV